MAAGVIPYSSVPGWPNQPTEMFEACQQAMGGSNYISRAPNGVLTSDVSAATTLFTNYSGGATELTYWKTQRQTALDTLFDANFDLKAFIRAGSATGVTGAGIGNFLATITNNYRSLRATITAATTVAQVQAVNVNSGWPSNP